jgi:phage terminase large subunit
MSEDLIQQEYFCSWDMGVEGAFYAKYLDKMRIEGRIGDVPWETGQRVHTAWDIGVRDSTTILFYTVTSAIVRVVDCYENSKEGLEHYVKVIQSKPYVYGKHIAPHDIAVKEWGSGMTRLEKAKQLGLNFTVAADVGLMDGIESVRSKLGIMYIDQTKCAPLIKALENYRQEYDPKHKVYKTVPLHNWASHFADAMRYLCVSLPKVRDSGDPQELDRRYYEAVMGEESTLPNVFRNNRY